jgi:hypothetical protein
VSNRARRLGVPLAAAVIVAAGALAPVAHAAGPSSVVAWNAIAQRAAIAVDKESPTVATATLAYVQVAVYDATVAIDGGGRPYALFLRPQPHASVDAAVATAARDMLVHLLPAQTAAIDADYATALAAIPAGREKDVGVAVGRLAAEAVIVAREGDGFGADIGFVMPAPAPGVWQLPPGAVPIAPWLSRMRPFILDRPDAFRPGPPPALSSPEWADAFNEVKAVGGATSTVRTAEQTTIARFWTTHAAQQWNTALGDLAQRRGLDVDQTARMFAMVDVIGTDAAIACWDAKYTYLFWRPEFAIPQGDADGNPATTGDPTWKPLAATPAHPEYPSAHGCVSTAAATALAAFLGTRRIDLDMRSTITPDMPTRHFDTVRELVHEIQNARVWAGIHFRFSTIVGARLGKQVARWDVRHGPFLAAPDDPEDG